MEQAVPVELEKAAEIMDRIKQIGGTILLTEECVAARLQIEKGDAKKALELLVERKQLLRCRNGYVRPQRFPRTDPHLDALRNLHPSFS